MPFFISLPRVVLEHHCDVAVFGRNVVHQTVTHVQFTASDVFQTCDHTQGSGLTAAGRTYKNDEFLVLNIQGEFLDSNDALNGDLQIHLHLGLLVALLFLLLFDIIAVVGRPS